MAWTAPPPMQSPDKIVPHTISVPVEADGTLARVQLLGEQDTVEVKHKTLTLALTGAPQYITLK